MTLTELKDYIQYGGEKPIDKKLTPINQNYDIYTGLQMFIIAPSVIENYGFRYGVKLDKKTVINNPQINIDEIDSILSMNNMDFQPIIDMTFPENFTLNIEDDEGETKYGINYVYFGNNYNSFFDFTTRDYIGDLYEPKYWTNVKFVTNENDNGERQEFELIKNGKVNEEVKQEFEEKYNINFYIIKCGYFYDGRPDLIENTNIITNEVKSTLGIDEIKAYNSQDEETYEILNQIAKDAIPESNSLNFIDENRVYFTKSFNELDYIEVKNLAESFENKLDLSDFDLTALEDYSRIFTNLTDENIKVVVGKNTFNESAYEGNKIKASLFGNYRGSFSKNEAIKKYYKIGDLKVLNYDYYNNVSASIPLEKIRKLFEE